MFTDQEKRLMGAWFGDAGAASIERIIQKCPHPEHKCDAYHMMMAVGVVKVFGQVPMNMRNRPGIEKVMGDMFEKWSNMVQSLMDNHNDAAQEIIDQYMAGVN